VLVHLPPVLPPGRHRVVDPAGAEPSPPRLALLYTLTVLVSVVVVAVVGGAVSRVVATAEAVNGAVMVTQMVSEDLVRPVLTDAVLAGDPTALAALGRAVRGSVLDDTLVRVKIWDATGTIVYSDEDRLIGERFDLGAKELEVLHGARPQAEVSDLTEAENRFEEPAVRLLEVYRSMRTPSGVPVLFEAYFRDTGVTAAAERAWLRFAPVSLGALVLLEVLQLPIVRMLVRRLRRVQAHREELLRRTLSAVEDERRRIAGDLHDGVVQLLVGVGFQLGAAARNGRAGREVDPDQLADAADGVRLSVRSLRSLLVEIYPPDADGGLPAALSDLVERLAPPGMRTDVDVDAELPALGTERTALIYRAAQEGLRNAVRHANASWIGLTLHRQGDMIVLLVSDDGEGCDPGRLSALPGHVGLRALAGLAAQSGAALLLQSDPGRGTTLRLEVPA
jgi:two-component system NarL family sensor kinase